MNQLIPTQQNSEGNLLVSGRDLHEFLEVGTRYDIWFRRMKEYGFIEKVDFIEVDQKRTTSHGREHIMIDHHIKIPMAKEISMLQRNKKGKEARLYFLELERKWNSPEMVMKRAMDYLNDKVQKLEEQKKRDEPYATFGKVVSNSDASINIGAFAKLLYDKHGINLGRNKLFAWLREKGYLIKTGRERNQPKQQYLEQGLFDTTVTLVSRTQGDVESVTTMVTGKGQVELSKKLLKEFEVYV